MPILSKSQTIRVSPAQKYLHALMMNWPDNQVLPPNTPGRLCQLLKHAIANPTGKAMEILARTEPLTLPGDAATSQATALHHALARRRPVTKRPARRPARRLAKNGRAQK